MPFIHTRTNQTVSPAQEQQMTRELGRAIGILGKSEQWLMLQFEDGCRMAFRGENRQPMAFVEVKLLGRAQVDAYERLTGEITRIVADALAVAPDCIYVKYEETEYWGWNGSNF